MQLQPIITQGFETILLLFRGNKYTKPLEGSLDALLFECGNYNREWKVTHLHY